MINSFTKTAVCALAGFAAIVSAAQAQDSAKPVNHAVSIENIHLFLDRQQDRFELLVLAKAEEGVHAQSAKIENFFEPVGTSRGFILASIQPYTTCAL